MSEVDPTQAGLMNFLRRALSSGVTGKPSSKRLLVVAAGATLMAATLAIAVSIAIAILRALPVDAGAVAALGVVAGPLAILAGASYQKQGAWGKRKARTSPG